MKRKIIYFILLIMISFISFNRIVQAEEYVSEMTPITKSISSAEVGNVTLDHFTVIRYIKTGTDIGTRFEIVGQYKMSYDVDTDIKVKYTFYDAAKNPIIEYNDDVRIYANIGGSKTRMVYTNAEGYDIDTVKYYVLEISVPTEVAIFDGADKGSYFYDNYNMEIDVKSNNVYKVNTTFLGKFKDAIRIVDMRIPFRHEYSRSDGTKVNKRAVISNIKISEDYVQYVEEGNKVISIGQSDTTATERVYSLEYDYNVGRDKLKGNDEFIFYLVKNNKVAIDNYTFKITMPKEFDKNNISVIDEAGNIYDGVEFEVNDNIITGKFKNLVSTDNTYIIRILLPDNYFTDTTLNISINTWVSFILPLVFMIITITVCFISKRTKNKKNETAGLYIEEDIDSLELGYILKNGVKETDISSLVFCLANKNYIKINMNKDSYTITKVKDYDGSKKLEEILMKRLFKDKDIVTRKDLKENLKNIKEEIEKKLKYKKDKKVYIHPIFNYKLIFWTMIFIIYYLCMNTLLFEYEPKDLFLTVVVGCIGLAIMLGPTTSKKYQFIEKMLCTMVGIVLIISPIILTSYKAFIQDNLYVASYILGIISIISIAVTSSFLSNRTVYGNYMYRKIMAYKSYLINVNEEEIKKEIEKNDNYFYDVLPYVLVMGMSDKFYDKFENIDIKKPDWYETNRFNLEEFYDQTKNIYSDFYLAIKNKVI